VRLSVAGKMGNGKSKKSKGHVCTWRGARQSYNRLGMGRYERGKVSRRRTKAARWAISGSKKACDPRLGPLPRKTPPFFIGNAQQGLC